MVGGTLSLFYANETVQGDPFIYIVGYNIAEITKTLPYSDVTLLQVIGATYL